jgi:hypothetical protein
MSWWFVVVIVVAALSVIGVVVRRYLVPSRPEFLSSASHIPGDRLGLRITQIGASLYALITAISTIVIVIGVFISEAVNVNMPVAVFWPKLLPSVHITDGPTAQVTGGGFQSAQVAITDLGLDAKLWLASGHLVQGLTYVVIAITIALLCTRLLGGNPFNHAMPRAFSFAAAAIAIGGLGWQVCFGVGGWKASLQTLTVTGWNINDRDVGGNGALDEIGWPRPGGGLSIDFWPIFIALALVAVAVAFRYGEKLQHDKVTLLQDKTRLERDTEGLV